MRPVTWCTVLVGALLAATPAAAQRVDVDLRVQFDARDSEAVAGDAKTAVDVARRRIGIGGTFRNVVAFEVEAELEANDPWRDVHVDYRQFEAVRVRAGQFKLPFSRDENTGSGKLDFVYRSRAASQLAPGRDRGVMVHGRLWRRALKYEAGLFVSDGSNARARRPDAVSGATTTASRLTVTPFPRSSSSLAPRESLRWLR